jgi:hypothetical protein
MEWYLVIDGVRRGPMSKASVLTLIEKGVVKPDTLVRKPGMPDWLPISHIREFSPGTPVPSTPIPAPQAAALAEPAAMAARPAKTAQRLPAYFGRHWRGEYSLAVSYWINWSLLAIVLGKPAEMFIDHVRTHAGISDDPRPLFATMIAICIAALAISVWQWVGVARSALRSKRETGKSLWPHVALVTVAISALACAALICQALPAVPRIVALFFDHPGEQYRVGISADGKELNISGRFDFGIAAQVRKALEQHPGVYVIVLDSDSGRASAGVALGSWLAEGRYTTVVRGRCVGPCSVAFAGGSTRLLAYGGTLAFYPPVPGQAGVGPNEIAATTARFLAARGIREDFVKKALGVEGRESWVPPPRELFDGGVISGAIVDGRVVDAQAYPAAAVQSILDGVAAEAPFKALKALDAAAFDASQARLRKLLTGVGSGDPHSAGLRHALRGELHDAALRYLPVTSDTAAARYLKARLDVLRVLRSSDADLCRSLIYPRLGHAGDPSDDLAEATAGEYNAALEAVLVDARAGDKRAPRDAQSAADRQQVLRAVLGRYPPVFARGIGHPDEFGALDARSVCAFHIALLEDIAALPAPRIGSAMRRLSAEVLGP